MATEPEEIADADQLYRRLAVHNIRQSDGSVHYNAFMRNADPRGRKREPDPDVSVDLAPNVKPHGGRMTANGHSRQIVQKLWNYSNVLRDDGLSCGDGVEQLTLSAVAVSVPVDDSPSRRSQNVRGRGNVFEVDSRKSSGLLSSSHICSRDDATLPLFTGSARRRRHG